MKIMNTDVAIVAGGPAGLAAAITAGENGLSSILFEKANTTGGAANMGMGPLGINTKNQFAAIAAGGADWGPWVQAILGVLLIILAIVLAIEGIQTISKQSKKAAK